jgi:phenylacetate-coenzyme A ligase PaaK-like adenylate-forming protein
MDNFELVKILQHAKNHVKYYNDNIPSDIMHVNDYDSLIAVFNNIPIIDKSLMKKNLKCFISDTISTYVAEDMLVFENDYLKEYSYRLPNETITVEYTSGTSGTPFLALKTGKERLKLGNNLWRLRNNISKITPDKMFNFIHHFGRDYPFPFQKPLDEKERIKKELLYLEHSNHTWWHIDANELLEYYTFLQRHNMNFTNLQVIENNGSFLSTEEKSKYENYFKCKLVNNYGCREVWTIAYDCTDGYLHISDESVIVQVVDDNDVEITEPNVYGNIVVTSLIQNSMPFIKYKLNDNVCYISGECKCGKKSKRISISPGRHIIMGTHIYGNQYFKDIILKLIIEYDVKSFDSISVTQYKNNEFTVNIKGVKCEKLIIENRFIRAAQEIFKNRAYKYIFTYDESLKAKSIFTVKQNY